MLMSFLNTEKKNAAWETKGYMEMEKKKKKSWEHGKVHMVGWEKSKQNRFCKGDVFKRYSLNLAKIGL